jgi:hypothetical protein
MGDKKNFITKNQAREVERFRVEKKPPRFFSREEIRLILYNCSAQNYPIYMINDEIFPVLLKLKAGSKGRLVVEKTNDKPYNRGLWLNFKRLLLSGHNSAVE